MKEDPRRLSRRQVLKATGLAALAALVPRGAAAGTKPDPAAAGAGSMVVPRRPLGRTGVQVPIVALGLAYDVSSRQLLMKQALKWGVTTWVTGFDYEGGNAPRGIGRYFQRFPADRDRVFLAINFPRNWADPSEPTPEQAVAESLARLGTDRIDAMIYSASASDEAPAAGLAEWAARVRKTGKVRHFGIATHSNMAGHLEWAARTGVVDLVLAAYNYRLAKDPAVQAALAACRKAGVGILAMKTRALGPEPDSAAADAALVEHFLRRGHALEPARVKAVWAHPAVTAAVLTVPSFEALGSFVKAACDPDLSADDARALAAHDEATRGAYCAGCSRHCQPAAPGDVPVADVLRHLMYANAYGDRERAAAWFAALPVPARQALAAGGFQDAEGRCPRGVPVARLMREASDRWC